MFLVFLRTIRDEIENFVVFQRSPLHRHRRFSSEILGVAVEIGEVAGFVGFVQSVFFDFRFRLL